MRAFGGEVPGCVTVVDSWRATGGRPPRRLRELRAHALLTILHGDGDAFELLLFAGVDPAGIRDRLGRGPLHLLAHLDRPHLVGRLVQAGLDIDERDANGQTPLHRALFDGGSAALVRALLDAGADPSVVDRSGESALHLLRCTEAATIVPWLVKAGLDLAAVDGYGRTPLHTQLITTAPAQTIRATLDAGADRMARDPWGGLALWETLRQLPPRDDLDFLLALLPDRPR